MSDRIKETLNSILDVFKSGKIPEAIAFISFPQFNIPSNSWSFLNRLILWISGTNDARGYRQWIAVGRHVKKGAKAIYILAPRMKKEKDEEEKIRLIGFLEVPVFKADETEGEPLDYEKNKIPGFPLMEKAKEWGLSVGAIGGNDRCWGYYTGNSIKLATEEEMVFFHELSHHAHKLVLGQLNPGQDWKQEIVAELSAEAICRLVGLKKDTTGNCYQYIERYAKKAELTPVNACLQVLSDVEKVIKLIIGKEPDDAENDTVVAGLLSASG